MVNGGWESSVMRGICSAFCLAIATVAIGLGGTAQAASSADCGRGPPAWWNAPRVTYTYSNASYADRAYIRGGSNHQFAAHRQSSIHSYRERSRRW